MALGVEGLSTTIKRKKKKMKLSRYGLPAIVLSLATAASADPFYDSLTTGIVNGVNDMKLGISPILVVIMSLTLLFTGVSLVMGLIKTRKPKVV